MCDVNSGEKWLQVDFEKDKRQKTEKKNIIVLIFSAYICYLILFLYAVLLSESLQGIFPLKPPAVSHFIMSQNAGQGGIHHELRVLFRCNYFCLICILSHLMQIILPLCGDVLPLFPIF